MNNWIPVTPESPCPVCGAHDGCSKSEDGELVRCMRADTAKRNNGWVRGKVGDDTYFLRAAEPEPKSEPIPKWKPFPTASLPEPLRGFVANVAVAVGCDQSFVAISALTMLASCIGNTRTALVDRGKRFIVPALLWIAAIAKSGDKKSPIFRLVMRPLREIHHRLYDEHMEAQERYDADLEEWKSRPKAKGTVKPAKPKPPAAERVVVSDTTFEALAPILLENWRGVLLHQDELSAWFGSFDRYANAKGGDCPKWLSVHDCEPITIDRKTGIPRTTYVPRPNVSIMGTIQPKTLARVLTNEYQDNGLAPRFLFACPPMRAYKWTDAEIPDSVEGAFEDVVHRLRALAPGEDKAGRPRPIAIPLSAKAKTLFIAFHDRLEEERVELDGALGAAVSKLIGQSARFALILQCVRGVTGEAPPGVIDGVSMEAGIALAGWFRGEAERVYATFSESPEEAESRQLLEWIQARGGSVTPRDLVRGPRRFRGNPAAAKLALDDLVEAGHGAWVAGKIGKSGGPPSRRFQLGDTGDGDITPAHGSATGGYVASRRVATQENTIDTPEADTPSEPHPAFDDTTDYDLSDPEPLPTPYPETGTAPALDDEPIPMLDPVSGVLVPRDKLLTYRPGHREPDRDENGETALERATRWRQEKTA